jgi:hypothetical protein
VKRSTPIPEDESLARRDRPDVYPQPASSEYSVVPVGPRTSLASTTSPGSSAGSSAPQKPAISTGVPAP